jgi:ketosteroid isomerase-like protein
MMSQTKTTENRIRALIEAWADAVRRHDLPGILAHHEQNLVMFDVPPPLQSKGMDEYKKTWDLFFKYHQPSQAFDIEELEITAGEDVAFAFAIMRCGSATFSGPPGKGGFLFRLTIGLRKVDGEWRITHEHHSIPADETEAGIKEARIRSAVNAWAQALRAKDVAGVVAHQTQDVVQFDFAPPLQTIGANRDGLQAWFATWRGQIGFEITDLRITAGEDVAFCHALVHLTGSRTDGSQSDVWFRNTLGLRKVGNAWKIAHGHESVPMHMDGSFRAAIDLQP